MMWQGGLERVSLIGGVLLLSAGVGCCPSKMGQPCKPCAPAEAPLPRPQKELQDVSFDYDSHALTDEAKGILLQNSELLKERPARQIQVEGHCDERGTREYNFALGNRRAQTALDYLRSLGIKREQMESVSYGEEAPLDSGHTEAAWQRNRRVHFSPR